MTEVDNPLLLTLQFLDYLGYAIDNYKKTQQPFFVMSGFRKVHTSTRMRSVLSIPYSNLRLLMLFPGFRKPHAPWENTQEMLDLYDPTQAKHLSL